MARSWRTIKAEDALVKVVYTEKVPRKKFLASGKYPVVSQEEGLVNGYWDNAADVFHVTRPLVVFGDHTRILKYIDFDFVLGADGVKLLQPIPAIDPKYFYYYLTGIDLKGLGYARHYRLLKEASISYPESLPEQRRIVKILDEVFEKTAKAQHNTEQNLGNSRAVFQATLKNAFANGVGSGESLSEVCEISSVLIDPREKEYRDMHHVGGANMVSETGKITNLKTAREEGLKSGKFLFDDHAVLYSKIRPYLKKVARPDFSGLCSADVYPLSPKQGKLNRDYLYYLLLSPEFTAYAIAESARAGMPKINRDRLFSFRFPFPQLQEQADIAEKLDSLASASQGLADIYKNKLTRIDELRRSVLYQALTPTP